MLEIGEKYLLLSECLQLLYYIIQICQPLEIKENWNFGKKWDTFQIKAQKSS